MALPSRQDRIAGCLLGGALGDAIGAHFEGIRPNTCFVMPADLRVTDDTQLTIATCESIIECRSVNPESIANHFARWFRDRRITGIGASTLKSLTELEAGGHWAMVSATGEYSAGNGAAMRVAPLAFFLDADNEPDRRTIRDVCRITHRNDEAYIGALAILRSIRHVIAGNEMDPDFVRALIDSLPDSRVRDRLIDVGDVSCTIDEYVSRFPSSGYVVNFVPIAVLAAVHSSNMLETIEQIVRGGGDTDTIASMFGQLPVRHRVPRVCQWKSSTRSTRCLWFAKPLPGFHAHHSRCNALGNLRTPYACLESKWTCKKKADEALVDKQPKAPGGERRAAEAGI